MRHVVSPFPPLAVLWWSVIPRGLEISTISFISQCRLWDVNTTVLILSGVQMTTRQLQHDRLCRLMTWPRLWWPGWWEEQLQPSSNTASRIALIQLQYRSNTSPAPLKYSPRRSEAVTTRKAGPAVFQHGVLHHNTQIRLRTDGNYGGWTVLIW